MNRTHYTYARRRQANAPRRRRLWPLVFFVGVLLLICGYGITSFSKEKQVSKTETLSSRPTLTNGAQLAWPATGQAAIGTVEDGLLAHSSHTESPRPTASMAKVIVALAIMKKQSFKLGQTGQTYTLTSKDMAHYYAEVARGGSVVPVYEGMVLTQYEAMQLMLLASANNIADMLVEKIFGSEKSYESYARHMLQDMGLSRTVVADASGFSAATISTPSDLVTIGIAALKNPVIAEIVAQPQAQIPGIGTIANTNKLLGVEGVVGIKTGTTDEAGSCLLFAARYTKNGQNITIVGVIMGDEDAVSLFDDSGNLLASAKRGFGLTEPVRRE